jgi:hypothetical protein
MRPIILRGGVRPKSENDTFCLPLKEIKSLVLPLTLKAI